MLANLVMVSTAGNGPFDKRDDCRTLARMNMLDAGMAA